jgi:6-phosphogluconolactonase/glucosamine-6-phosphate isomerase/deaminase
MAASSSAAISGIVKAHKVLQKKEKTPTIVFRVAADANRYVASEIATLIRTSTKKPIVLGLATGSTPVGA